MSSRTSQYETERKIREGAKVWNDWRMGKGKDELSLHQANLIGQDFTDYDLSDINFRQAILRNANFSKARGLRDLQFSGADLSGALFPEGFQFSGLEIVAETSKQSRFSLFFLISGCLLSLMAIKGISDAELITDSGKIQLPFLQANISSKYFIFVAPGLVAILFFYFHLYLQHLWRELGNQPNFFPDGRSLDEKVYPWLVNGLFKPVGKDSGGGLFVWLRIITAKTMTWGVAPVTLIFMELFFLLRKDCLATTVQLILIFGVLLYSSATYSYMTNSRTHGGTQDKGYWIKRSSVSLAIIFLLALFSFEVFNGPKLWDMFYPNVYKEDMFKKKGNATLVCCKQNLDEQLKPGEQFKKVHEVNLENRNLRFINAAGADFFGGKLAGANLYGANLDGATLIGADLSNADLTAASLINVAFEAGSLDGANMTRSSFSFVGTGPSMKNTNLSHASSPEWIMPNSKLERIVLKGFSSTNLDLCGANLTEADLSVTELAGGSNNLSRAILRKANLSNSNMKGINLSDANLFQANLKGGAFSGANFRYAKLRQATLDRASFENADLTGAWLSGASTIGTDFSGAILTDSMGLTFEMLKVARISATTVLPPELEARRLEIEK